MKFKIKDYFNKEKLKEKFTKDKIKARLIKEIPLILGLLIVIILFIIPSSYSINDAYSSSVQAKATVIEVDDQYVVNIGIIKQGEERCTVRIDDGKFKNQTYIGINLLTGSLENDKMFSVGDEALVRVNYDEDFNITSVSMIDHYRINYEIIIAVIFIIILIIFARGIGLKAILSFVITVLAIWKILIPSYLDGNNPIIIGLVIVALLTVIIEVFVYGFNKKSLSAISGSFLGIITTCILGILFTDLFKIHGAIMANSEQLLYNANLTLDLTQIYMATIFIGSSGALMDIAVDITSSIVEVVKESPNISFIKALKAGLNVGRSAMGTMSTTLLLAYSGGSIALLMVFVAQGTPIIDILNYKTVAAQIIDTIIGSLGLVAVAPFTALTSAFFLTNRKHKEKAIDNQIDIK